MISNDGVLLIKYFEGEKLSAYKDTNGYPTIGVGHLILPVDNLHVGDTITDEQSTAFLQKDLANAEKRVKRFTKDMILQQCELDALISQAYNIRSFPLLVTHLINEGKEVYLQKTLLYCKDAAGHELLGLKKRRQAEVWLFQGQNWDEILPKLPDIT